MEKWFTKSFKQKKTNFIDFLNLLFLWLNQMMKLCERIIITCFKRQNIATFTQDSFPKFVRFLKQNKFIKRTNTKSFTKFACVESMRDVYCMAKI